MKKITSLLSCSFVLALSFISSSIADELISQPQKETAQALLEEALSSDLGFSIVESLTYRKELLETVLDLSIFRDLKNS